MTFVRRWTLANTIALALGFLLYTPIAHGISGHHGRHLSLFQWATHAAALGVVAVLVAGALGFGVGKQAGSEPTSQEGMKADHEQAFQEGLHQGRLEATWHKAGLSSYCLDLIFGDDERKEMKLEGILRVQTWYSVPEVAEFIKSEHSAPSQQQGARTILTRIADHFAEHPFDNEEPEPELTGGKELVEAFAHLDPDDPRAQIAEALEEPVDQIMDAVGQLHEKLATRDRDIERILREHETAGQEAAQGPGSP